jgi:hypothetical protein
MDMFPIAMGKQKAGLSRDPPPMKENAIFGMKINLFIFKGVISATPKVHVPGKHILPEINTRHCWKTHLQTPIHPKAIFFLSNNNMAFPGMTSCLAG